MKKIFALSGSFVVAAVLFLTLSYLVTHLVALTLVDRVLIYAVALPPCGIVLANYERASGAAEGSAFAPSESSVGSFPEAENRRQPL